ncbi:hypothetical protein V8C86DRAFT_2585948 [Haematococcus lacustris]
MCSYGPDCRRGICFFAHQPPELRVVDQSYLQEIERQLDAMGVSSAAFGFPPSNNAKVQHHQERGTPGGSSNTTGASSTAAGSERSERGTGTGSGDRGADRSSGQGASQPGSTHHTPRARVPMGTGLGTVGGLVGGAPDEVSTAALLVQLQLQRTTGEPVPKSLKTQSSSLQAHASPGPSTPGSAMPGDKSEQDKIMQAAALLGMDPMQLAHLKQLYGSKSAHQGMRGLSAQSSACVTPTAAGLGGGGHGGQGSQQALLQAAMQQMMAQASSATGMSAAPASPLNHLNHSQGMLLGTPGSTGHSQTLGYQLSGSREHGGRPGQGMGSNDSNDSAGNNNMNSDLSAGFAAGMMAALQGGAISARDSLPNPHQSPHHMQQQHSGFPAQQNSAAASSLLASSLSLRSPLPSLSANDETMAATLKLLADLTMGSRSNAASDTAATLHQQQQQAAASAMAAHFMSAAQQRDQQQSLQQSASYNHEGGAFSAAAAAAAAALMGHSFTGADGNSMALPNSHVHPGQVSAAPPSTSYPGHPSLSSLQLAGVLQQMSMQLMAQGNGAEGQAQAAALATMLPDLLRSLHDPRAPPLPSSPAPGGAPFKYRGTPPPPPPPHPHPRASLERSAMLHLPPSSPLAPGSPYSGAGHPNTGVASPSHYHHSTPHSAGMGRAGPVVPRAHTAPEGPMPLSPSMHRAPMSLPASAGSQSLSLSLHQADSMAEGSGTPAMFSSHGCPASSNGSASSCEDTDAGQVAQPLPPRAPGTNTGQERRSASGAGLAAEAAARVEERQREEHGVTRGMMAAAMAALGVDPGEAVEMSDLMAHPELHGADHLLQSLSAMISEPSNGGNTGSVPLPGSSAPAFEGNHLLPSRHSLAAYASAMGPLMGSAGSESAGVGAAQFSNAAGMGAGGRSLLEQKGSLAFGAFDFNHRAHNYNQQQLLSSTGPFALHQQSKMAALFAVSGGSSSGSSQAAGNGHQGSSSPLLPVASGSLSAATTDASSPPQAQGQAGCGSPLVRRSLTVAQSESQGKDAPSAGLEAGRQSSSQLRLGS